MIIPTPGELIEGFRRFKEREALAWRLLLRPHALYSLLKRYGYVQFFLVGGSGVVVNLSVTWALTTFVYGVQHYFDAYLFGLGANLAWSFVLFTFAIFKTKGDHVRRLAVFVLYFIVMTWVNTLIVRAIVAMVGVEYYLIVIAGVILALSTFNFFVFKLSLFKERE